MLLVGLSRPKGNLLIGLRNLLLGFQSHLPTKESKTGDGKWAGGKADLGGPTLKPLPNAPAFGGGKGSWGGALGSASSPPPFPIARFAPLVQGRGLGEEAEQFDAQSGAWRRWFGHHDVSK